MVYLIVGIDRRTLAPWHRNIGARNTMAAKRIALACAAADGIHLVVAAVIGPHSSVVADIPSAHGTKPKAA
jgi:hypothetical protein